MKNTQPVATQIGKPKRILRVEPVERPIEVPVKEPQKEKVPVKQLSSDRKEFN